ncbi:UNVERIFIED_CONTAM: hypothetical protein K2H54_037346 [Gekko kuhli]
MYWGPVLSPKSTQPMLSELWTAKNSIHPILETLEKEARTQTTGSSPVAAVVEGSLEEQEMVDMATAHRVIEPGYGQRYEPKGKS